MAWSGLTKGTDGVGIVNSAFYMRPKSTKLASSESTVFASFLGTFTKIGAIEAGATHETQEGETIDDTEGDTYSTSEKIVGEPMLLNVTKTNYDHLRSTYHNKACDVMFYDANFDRGSAVGGSGWIYYDVLPGIFLEAQEGAVYKIKITFQRDLKNATEQAQLFEVLA